VTRWPTPSSRSQRSRSDQKCIWRLAHGARRGRQRSRKPSPCRVFLSLSGRTDRETRQVCPELCPGQCASISCARRGQSALVVAFSVEGDGSRGSGLHGLVVERFNVSAFVSYTCRCAVRWPSGRRRRFAKAARNPRTGLKSMISGPFFIGVLVGVGCGMMLLGPRLGTLLGTLQPMPMCV